METVDLSTMEELPELEEIGKRIQADQLRALLKTFWPQEKERWKLVPILMGMAQPPFLEMVTAMTPEEIKMLQCDIFTDAIYHQLTLLLPYLGMEKGDQAVDAVRSHILSFDPLQASKSDLLAIKEEIAEVAAAHQRQYLHIDRTLALSWYHHRPDLIKHFSKRKEHCQGVLTEIVGHPENKKQSPTGLYLLLEERLWDVYGELKDSDPSIDALERFSIRYLQDYFALGLLPEVSTIKELDLSAEHPEQERIEYRQNLFRSAKKNLEARDLKTIHDLRKAGIFSRKMLEEHLKTLTY